MSTAVANGEMTVAKKRDINDMEFNYVPLGEKESIKLTIGLALKYLMPPTKGGHRATEQDAMKFLMLCRARELNPWVGDAYAVGYDTSEGPVFNLITAVQALFKRAELHPQYDGIESGVIVRRKPVNGESFPIEHREGDFFAEDEVLLGGWARVYRKDCKRPFFESIKLATYNKGISVWKSNPEGMISKCSEAGALRKAFPNQLSGLYTKEEMDAHASGVIDSPEKPKVVSDLDSLAKDLAEKQSARKSIAQQDEPEKFVVKEPEEAELAEIVRGPGVGNHANVVESEPEGSSGEPDIVGDYKSQIGECDSDVDLKLIESSIKRSQALNSEEKVMLGRHLKTRREALSRGQ
jgi:phage recombination protein Bet